MMEIANTILNAVKIILTNPIGLFFLVFIASQWCMGYLQPLVLKAKWMNFEQKAVFSCLNGVILVVLFRYLHIVSPVILLALSPMILVFEVMVMTKDSPYTYLYMLIKLWVNFICIYWMIVSLLGLFSVIYITGDIVFPLTLLTSAWIAFLFGKHPKYPMKELKIMMHRKRIGSLHFVFLLGCVISLFFSTIVLGPIIVDDVIFRGSIKGVQEIFFIEMFLKTSLVFSSGYLLLFVQARELKQKENVKILSLELEKEEDYRRSVQQEAYLSFYVNATRDQIQEGRDVFTAFMWHDINNYAEMLQKMAFLCIHPEHLSEFVSLNSLFLIEEKMEEGINTGKQRMKVRPKEMLSLFNLPPKVQEKYNSLKEEWAWVEASYVYLKESETGDILIHVSISDINEEMKRSEQLVKDATIDKLTGVYNRAALQCRIEDQIRLAKREGCPAGTMVLLDVDSFKAVNDKLGHPTGDVALQTVAQNLKTVFRSDDIIGRLGGDEFCVFMLNTIDASIVRKRLEEVNILCRKEYPVPGEKSILVSVSIGAVICVKPVDGYEDIYALADEALYYTKENGKDSYTLHSN